MTGAILVLGSVPYLGGGFKYFFMFIPIWVNDPN